MPNMVFTDFSAGEVSPRMEGRLDMPQYQKSCRQLKNMVLDSRGGADRRPGLAYQASARDSTKSVRLIEFVYNSSKAYALALDTGGYVRIYNSDGTVHSTLSGAAWTTDAILFSLHYASHHGTGTMVMYFYCRGMRIHSLTYTEATDSFAISATVAMTGTTFNTTATAPATGTFHERRHVVGFSESDLMTTWGSKAPNTSGVPQYTDFTVGTAADSAWQYTIAADRGDEGLWLVSHRDLLIGCLDSEYNMSGLDAGITPTNVFIRRQTRHGSCRVMPHLIDDAVMFASRNGRKVKQQVFSREGGGYQIRDLTFWADHITGDGVVDTALQTDPDTIGWYVTDDGNLIGITYNRALQTYGWHEHTTTGTFESVCVLPGLGSALNSVQEDSIWVVVNRTINGSAVRYIEKFKPRDQGTVHEDLFFVDSGITIEGVGATTVVSVPLSATATVEFASAAFTDGDLVRFSGTGVDELDNQVFKLDNGAAAVYELWDKEGTVQINSSGFSAAATTGSAIEVVKVATGLSHLEGATVHALVDGANHDSVVVSSGSATLNGYYNTIQIGLPYTSTLETMRLAMAPGERKRIHALSVRFYSTVGCYWGPDADTLERVPFDPAPVVGEAPDLFTGDKRRSFDGKWSDAPSVLLSQSEPNPMNVLFIIAETVVSSGKGGK